MSLPLQIPSQLRDQLRPYWRRRWVILILAWGVSLLGWLAVLMLSDRYEAMTRIYVETENLLTPLLRNITVQADVTKQLEVMQKTLLNRNNIAQVAHAADLDLDLRTDLEKEALYAQMARQVTLKAEGNNLFLVAYTSSDPRLAKKIVEALLNIFVETNLGQNRASMESARNFIETEIAEYERKLKEADERLADYKAHHISVLAGAGTTSFSTRLDGARQDLANAKMKVEELTVQHQQLASNLSSVQQYLEVDSPAQVIVTGNAPAPASGQARVQQLEAELSQLRSLYTDQHPDVAAARRSLEHARQVAEQGAGNGSSGSGSGRGRISNPVYEQIKLRMIQAETDLAQAQSRVRASNEEVNRLQGLAETAPQVEAELADLNREYGVIKSKYEELLGRRESARISEAAETKGDKVQFRIIEPPQVPALPSFPNRPLFASAVLFLSLGLGAGLAFLLHKIDDTIGSAAELAEEFNIQVVGAIPQVQSLQSARQRAKEARSLGIAAGGFLATYLMVMACAVFYRTLAPLVAAKLLPLMARIHDLIG